MCEMFANFEPVYSKYLSTLNQKSDPIGVLFRDHPFNFLEHETKVRISFFFGQEKSSIILKMLPNLVKNCSQIIYFCICQVKILFSIKFVKWSLP